ncbi:MAG: hypothetical protein HY820_15150 [Acidobacteria bacterium]|nr:hypothetical protein [Acidobacteriota bacterium]
MFDSLDETMKHDEETGSSARERLMRYVLVAVAVVVTIGGLMLGIRYLE